MQPKIRAGLPVEILKSGDDYIIGCYTTPGYPHPIAITWNKDGTLIDKLTSTQLDLIYSEENK